MRKSANVLIRNFRKKISESSYAAGILTLAYATMKSVTLIGLTKDLQPLKRQSSTEPTKAYHARSH